MNRNGRIIISVCIITYNHESYIKEAIEGALNQKLNCDYEIVIGEDHSSDKTAEICSSYAIKYPNLIRLRKNESNLGMSRNLFDSLMSCSGEYIAICEGDDFWTDPLKLQKQVNFLDQNPDFSICFHNSKILYEDHPERVAYSNIPAQEEITTFEDLAKGEFIYTATCLFRNENFRKFPEKYAQYLNNYTLDLQNAQFGKIKFINEVMSTYRVHKGGVWSMVSREKILIDYFPTYKFYLDYFDRKYRKYFISHLRQITAELISIKLEKGNLKNFWTYYYRYLFYNIRNKGESKHIVSIFFKSSNKMVKKLFKANG